MTRAATVARSRRRASAATANDRTTLLVIETDPQVATRAGGHWWNVPVPQVSPRAEVNCARADYERALLSQRLVD